MSRHHGKGKIQRCLSHSLDNGLELASFWRKLANHSLFEGRSKAFKIRRFAFFAGHAGMSLVDVNRLALPFFFRKLVHVIPKADVSWRFADLVFWPNLPDLL